MPGTTPRGYPFPLPTEPADGSPQIEALARAIDTDLELVAPTGVRAFADAAARDAAIPAPTDGTTAYLQDVDGLEVFDGTLWQGVADRASGTGSYTGTPASNVPAAVPVTTNRVLVGRTLSYSGGKYVFNRAARVDVLGYGSVGLTSDSFRFAMSQPGMGFGVGDTIQMGFSWLNQGTQLRVSLGLIANGTYATYAANFWPNQPVVSACTVALSLRVIQNL